MGKPCDAHELEAFILNQDDDFFAKYEPLITAIERDVADDILQTIEPAELADDLQRFVITQVQAAIAKNIAVDVATITRRAAVRFYMNELEADGLIEKTGEIRTSADGEFIPVYRVKYPAGKVMFPGTDSKN